MGKACLHEYDINENSSSYLLSIWSLLAANTSCRKHICGPNFDITVPVDVMVTNDARPSPSKAKAKWHKHFFTINDSKCISDSKALFEDNRQDNLWYRGSQKVNTSANNANTTIIFQAQIKV